MRTYFSRGVILVAAAWLAWQTPVQAQSYSTNFDLLANGASVLAGSTGAGQWMGVAGSSASVSNGVYTNFSLAYTNFVVFQGEISNVFPRIAPDGNNIASVQLFVQVVMSSTMPDSSICPTRQGGVCFSNGNIYAWATNGWLLLNNTNGPALTVASNDWVQVTMLANYTGADTSVNPTTTNIVFYQVYINGTNLVPTSLSDHYSHGSPFHQSDSGSYIQSSALYDVSNKGINGFYLSGSGAVDEIKAQTGVVPFPLSAGIDIRSFQGADGVYVEFKTLAEESDGTVTLIVKDANGNIIWQGSQTAVGSGNNLYRFKVPGLVLGGRYNYTVIDEVGKQWKAPNVAVTPFATDMVQMSPLGITMQFNTIPRQQYEIQWVRQLGDSWQPLTSFTAVYERSSVFVQFPDTAARAGFFRIIMK